MYRSKIKKSRFLVIFKILWASLMLASCKKNFGDPHTQLNPKHSIISEEKMSTIKMHQFSCNSLREENGICNCKPIEVSGYDELYEESTKQLKPIFNERLLGENTLINGACSEIKNNEFFIHTRAQALITADRRRDRDIEAIQKKKNLFYDYFYDVKTYIDNNNTPRHMCTQNDMLYVFIAKITEHPLLLEMRNFFDFVTKNFNEETSSYKQEEQQVKFREINCSICKQEEQQFKCREINCSICKQEEQQFEFIKIKCKCKQEEQQAKVIAIKCVYEQEEQQVKFREFNSIIEKMLSESTMMHGFDLNNANFTPKSDFFTKSKKIDNLNLVHPNCPNLSIELKSDERTTFTMCIKRDFNKFLNVHFWYDIWTKKFICKKKDLSKLMEFHEIYGILLFGRREISLHFMLHLNEDFDDNLLADAIDLLHGED